MPITEQQLKGNSSVKKYVCATCADTFYATRPANYCSGACKQQAYLGRKKENAITRVAPDIDPDVQAEIEAEEKLKQKLNLK